MKRAFTCFMSILILLAGICLVCVPASGEGTGENDFTIDFGDLLKPKVKPGDVNGDGTIDSLDGLLLMRYLNDWDVEIKSPKAMDVNGDGAVDSLDGLLLMRYLNGWDVTLGS